MYWGGTSTLAERPAVRFMGSSWWGRRGHGCGWAWRTQPWLWVWVAGACVWDGEDGGMTIWGGGPAELCFWQGIQGDWDTEEQRPVSRGLCGSRVHERSDLESVDRSKQYVKDSNICLPSESRQQSNGAGASSRAMESQSPREKCFQQERAVGIVEWCGVQQGADRGVVIWLNFISSTGDLDKSNFSCTLGGEWRLIKWGGQ